METRRRVGEWSLVSLSFLLEPPGAPCWQTATNPSAWSSNFSTDGLTNERGTDNVRSEGVLGRMAYMPTCRNFGGLGFRKRDPCLSAKGHDSCRPTVTFSSFLKLPLPFSCGGLHPKKTSPFGLLVTKTYFR